MAVNLRQNFRPVLISLIIGLFVTDVNAPLPNRDDRSSLPTVSSFLERVSNLLRSFQRFTDHHNLSNPRSLSPSALTTLEHEWETLQVVLQHFESLSSELPIDLHQPVEESLRGIIQCMRRVREALQNDNRASEVIPESRVAGGTCERVTDGNRGPSRYDIQRNQLETLLKMRMTLSDIARSRILGTGSRNTLYNHCKRLNIQLPRQQYSQISDTHLAEVVQQVHEQQPHSGSEEVRATLRSSRGLTVQRHRVRRALALVDPVGTACRWGQVTQRRAYSVKSPNSLWHLDNNHALKRWGFYIHGGIDGYSRTVTFLYITMQNRAPIALQFFISGIRNWGLPSRIRLDRGSEYNECHRFMEWQMGADRGSAIRGKSVHNQRIERLWRDVYAKVLDIFYKLFHHLEDSNALDISNPIHMFALRYTYVPIIQSALSRWADVHNSHGIRTAHHRTPQQIWTTAMMQQRCSLQAHSPQERPSIAVQNVFEYNVENSSQEVWDRFGIDLTETIMDIINQQIMMHAPINETDFRALQHQIDPLRPSNVQGIDIYEEVINFLLDLDRPQEES